jgi:hypothetical protein
MRPTDFPQNFVNRHHPADYILVPDPIIPEYILHDKRRLFLRISWKTATGYLPVTFMVDTTHPNAMSFCPEGMRAICNSGIRYIDESLGYLYVRIHCGGAEGHFFETEMKHSQEKSVNILGLPALMKLGLHVDSRGFRFDDSIPWF